MSFWPLFVLMVVIFAAMVLVLRHVVGRHYLRAIAHLQSLSAEYSRRHEELKQHVEEAERQYKEQTARAQAEAERIVSEARREADSVVSERLDEAHRDSERIVQQAMESRDALRKELEQAMEARAIERACELIHAALPEPLRREIHVHWFSELLQNGLTQLARLKTDEPIQEARVLSAFPLSASQRSTLREKLQGALGREMAVTEETDDRLVAGLTITVGSRVLDGSLASKVRQAARQAHTTS